MSSTILTLLLTMGAVPSTTTTYLVQTHVPTGELKLIERFNSPKVCNHASSLNNEVETSYYYSCETGRGLSNNK